MPEGHALHRLAAEINAVFAGRPVRSTSPQGRFTGGAGLVDGTVLAGAETFGKHLFVSFDDVAAAAHVHLGLYGRWTFTAQAGLPVVGAIRWRLEDAATTADLRGPIACELLEPPAVDAVINRLGPDPIRADADPDRAWQRIRRSQRPIAALLMDQAVIAGPGNIFRAEVLFRQRIAPFLPGARLGHDQWEALWDDLVTLMRAAVDLGRIDTVRPEHEPETMGRLPREDRHGGEVYVYRRALMDCHVCGHEIAMQTLEGRHLFWCPHCQPRR